MKKQHSQKLFNETEIERFWQIGLVLMLLAITALGYYADYQYRKMIVRDAMRESLQEQGNQLER